MKHIFTLLLLLAALLFPATTIAHDFEVDGIYYNIINDNNEVEVTFNGEDPGASYSGDVTIPATVIYNGTTYSVTAIRSIAFWNCNGLTGISIPNTVTSIGDDAFNSCTSLTDIEIPNSITSIGNGVFKYCTALTNITIPNTVLTIGDEAFSGCSGLTSIHIPNSVTTISHGVFSYCTNLTSIDIPNSVTSIGDHAFEACISLSSIDIPNSVTSIGNNAFDCCFSLTSIDIPNSVTSIGWCAFRDCTSLTSISIPNSVTSIGSLLFIGCFELTSINVVADNPVYDSRNNCNAIIETASNTLINGCSNTIIPNSVTAIDMLAFNGCSNLISITIPNSVTTIGESAFNNCSSLTSITIPNSVTTIGNGAFSECDSLDEVYCFILNPGEINMGTGVFEKSYSNNDYSDRTLYVPYGKSDDYQTDTKWSSYFGSIVEMDPVLATAIELDKTATVVIEGETLQLNASVVPDITTNKTVSWATSNPNVATVDENGLMTAVGLGTATITAMTTDGSNLSASCQVTVTSMSATNMFVIQDAETLHGESITIPVALTNDQTILAFQTDIFLPEGFALETNEAMEPVVTPSNRLTSDHVLMTQYMSNGAVRVMCYSPNLNSIEEKWGDLFYFTVGVPENAAGDYTIYLRNSRLTTTDYTELRTPDAGAVLTVMTYIPGDANDSRSVNVADIVTTAMYIMEMDPSPFIFDAADMNGDGEITVTDIMLIARLVLYPNGIPVRAQAPAISGNDDRMSGEDISLMTDETRTVSILLDNEMDYSAFQLDLSLPQGLSASNFQLTDRAGNHALDVNTLANGKTRVLCYTPAIEAISGHEGAVLTFDVSANSPVDGDITVDGIELVTTACQMVRLDAFTIGVNGATSVNEVVAGKTIARVDYYNVAGQRLAQPESGVTLVVTTHTDGTCTTTKLIQ